MEKASIEMDLEEWEFLPDKKSFLDFGQEGGKDLFSKEICMDATKGIVDMNYFICPSPTSPFTHGEEEEPSPAGEPRRDRAPIPAVEKKRPEDELAKEFKDIGVVPPVIVPSHDVVSQVFFKVKENEFVDMKVNSPKSSTRGIIPHVEPEPIPFDEDQHKQQQQQQEEEEEEVYKAEEMERKMSKNSAFEKDEDHPESDAEGKPRWESFGFNVWRWRLTGVGALCSIGVAAATLCIFILGGRQRQRQQQQHQRIQLQIYADDKRIKQMVQQATRLNQALSAVRGAPIARAHISFGGYYDGL